MDGFLKLVHRYSVFSYDMLTRILKRQIRLDCLYPPISLLAIATFGFVTVQYRKPG